MGSLPLLLHAPTPSPLPRLPPALHSRPLLLLLPWPRMPSLLSVLTRTPPLLPLSPPPWHPSLPRLLISMRAPSLDTVLDLLPALSPLLSDSPLDTEPLSSHKLWKQKMQM